MEFLFSKNIILLMISFLLLLSYENLVTNFKDDIQNITKWNNEEIKLYIILPSYPASIFSWTLCTR
jgi:hypothetical protein